MPCNMRTRIQKSESLSKEQPRGNNQTPFRSTPALTERQTSPTNPYIHAQQLIEIMRLLLMMFPFLVESLLPSRPSLLHRTQMLLSSKESQKVDVAFKTIEGNSSQTELSYISISNGELIGKGGEGMKKETKGEVDERLSNVTSSHNGKSLDSKTKPRKSEESNDNDKKKETVESASRQLDEKASNGKTKGIGGKGGVTYDVNRLKTNFVQKAIAAYKDQLWELLGNPDASQEAIEEKIAALCQANPVSTTTDSNLLEGKWEFVFSSKKPARVLLDPDRFSIGYESEFPGDIVGATKGSSRLFILESLEINQSPYVVDEKPYGILDCTRHYNVASLTRTSLDLGLQRSTWNLFGVPVWCRRYIANTINPVDLKILYVDSDICISVENNMNQPFTIYTKSSAWTTRVQQLRRKWKRIRAFARKFKIRSRVMRFRTRFTKESDMENSDSTAWLEYDSDNGTIRLIKLGDFDYEDDLAWEGEADPFVHLPADERQQLIKSLKIGEIQAIGKKQQRLIEKMRRKKLIFSREKTFKKPIDERGNIKVKSNQINREQIDGKNKMKFKRQKPFNKPQ